MPTPSRAPLLVVGMHRSGTSYLASLLQSLGVKMGPQLVGAQRGNPRGHFEDTEILAFHQAALARRHDPARTLYDDGTIIQFPVDQAFSPEENETARILIAARQTNTPWGWKEPRTSLFLSSWLKLLPGSRVVTISRHPLEIHFSLLRRGTWETVIWPDHVIRSWSLHLAAIAQAESAANHPFLWLTSAQAFQDIPKLQRDLVRFGNLTTDRDATAEFAAKEFHQLKLSTEAVKLFARCCPLAAAWWDYAIAKARGESVAPPSQSFHELSLSQESDFRRLECLVAAENDLDLTKIYQNHRDLLVQRLRETEKWNDEAEEIHRNNAFLNAELEKIGAAFVREQAFAEELTEKLEKTWAELTKVGESWEAQRDHIQALHRERATWATASDGEKHS